ncbi:hypothetical protein [Pyrococcus kukulkanii]|uniref:Uncharacterized protein n=1 Tax=Pyrococcus kukulkanii TaxID=1609559 RepID=A0ABV4T5R5_9EURY
MIRVFVYDAGRDECVEVERPLVDLAIARMDVLKSGRYSFSVQSISKLAYVILRTMYVGVKRKEFKNISESEEIFDVEQRCLRGTFPKRSGGIKWRDKVVLVVEV